MTYKVSITDFRNNLTNYIDLALAGKNVTVRDEKKGVDLVKITKADQEDFNWDEHLKWMENFKPILKEVDVKDYEKRRKKTKMRLKKYNW